jgi:hypothetical protein
MVFFVDKPSTGDLTRYRSRHAETHSPPAADFDTGPRV